MIERRLSASGLEVRAEDDMPRMAGYAAVFNSMSEDLGGFRERIEQGAFRGSLGKDIRALWNHNSDNVIGRTTAGTLRLEEDERGLYSEIFPPESAGNYMESVRRGDVSQMSFGFIVNEDVVEYMDDGTLLRRLVDVELMEVSPVAFPAYPETSINARSIDELRERAMPSATPGQIARARVRRKLLERLYG